MPASRTIWLLTFSVAISFALTFTGCENKREKDGKPGTAISSDAEKRVRVLNTVPRFTLDSESGKPFGSKQLLGKAWIATFIFTRCQQTCPLQTDKMGSLQKQLQTHPSSKDIHRMFLD